MVNHETLKKQLRKSYCFASLVGLKTSDQKQYSAHCVWQTIDGS